MIIGLSGVAGSGKDTVGKFLVQDCCFESMALADPMKRFCKEMFGWDDERLYGPSSARNAPDETRPRPDGTFLTARYALQQLGTEWGRDCYENVWVDYAIRKARERLAFYRSDGVVITDVRFKNERDAIWKAGGKVWRIVRPGAGLIGAAASHVSETELTDDMAYDRVINNNDGPLEDLRARVIRAIGGRS